MKIKGIIFDLDGTLLNTIEDIGDSMNQVLQDMDLQPLTYDEYKLKVGGGFKKLVISILGNSDEEALKKLEDAYRENYLNKAKPYENIEKLLEILVDRDIKIAINTNKNQEYTNRLIEAKLPKIEFLDMIGVDSRGYVKPDPRGAEILVEKMGINKREILYVGDSNIDIMTGKNAGLKTVGVDWGFRGERELKEYGADYIVYDPMEILDIL